MLLTQNNIFQQSGSLLFRETRHELRGLTQQTGFIKETKMASDVQI